MRVLNVVSLFTVLLIFDFMSRILWPTTFTIRLLTQEEKMKMFSDFWLEGCRRALEWKTLGNWLRRQLTGNLNESSCLCKRTQVCPYWSSNGLLQLFSISTSVSLTQLLSSRPHHDLLHCRHRDAQYCFTSPASPISRFCYGPVPSIVVVSFPRLSSGALKRYQTCRSTHWIPILQGFDRVRVKTRY